MTKLTLIAALTACACAVALVFAVTAGAPNNPPKCKGKVVHGKCKPKPPSPPPPAPTPPAPQPAPTTTDCDHSVMGGKDGNPGNDDCVPDVKPQTPSPQPPAVVPPAPPAVRLACPAGMQEIGRTSSEVLCSKTVVQVKRVKGKTVIKKVPGKTRTKFLRYCPRKPDDHGLAG